MFYKKIDINSAYTLNDHKNNLESITKYRKKFTEDVCFSSVLLLIFLFVSVILYILQPVTYKMSYKESIFKKYYDSTEDAYSVTVIYNYQDTTCSNYIGVKNYSKIRKEDIHDRLYVSGYRCDTSPDIIFSLFWFVARTAVVIFSVLFYYDLYTLYIIIHQETDIKHKINILENMV